jgi:pyrroloquinoline quinone (PQQ) biosynthesis protein C
MNFTVTVSNAIDQKVSERAMLSHSFYQAWTEGRLSLDTLRARHLRRQGHRCHCIN